MPGVFEMYNETGNVFLDLNTKPIGHKVNFSDIKAIGRLSDVPGVNDLSSPARYVTGSVGRLTTAYESTECSLDIKWKHGFVPAYQLKDGMCMETGNSLLFSDVSIMGQNLPNGTVAGRVASINMLDRTIPQDKGKYLSAYSPTGELIWSLESLANSIQRVDEYTHKFTDTNTHRHPGYYFEIPSHIDIEKVFYTPMSFQLPYAGDTLPGDIDYAHFITMKREGRRIYIVPTYWVWFNVGYTTSYHNLDSPIKDNMTGPSITMLLWYIPSG